MSRVDVTIGLGPTVPEVYYPTGVVGTTGLGTATGGIPGTTYPNEPVGFTRVVHHRFPAPLTSLGANAVDGSWSYVPSANLTVVADATDPDGNSSALRYRFPIGLTGGDTPAQAWAGWSEGRLSEVYTAMDFKIEGTTFEGNQSDQRCKIWFLGSSGLQASNNEVVLGIYKPTSEAITASAFRLWVAIQNISVQNCVPNINTTDLLTVGVWHQVETYFRTNTIGVANGVCRVWINGTLCVEYTNCVFRTATYPLGFYFLSMYPYWGGTGGAKTQEDYTRFGSMYISGVV